MIEERSNNQRGGVTSIADIAFATLNNGKIAYFYFIRYFILFTIGYINFFNIYPTIKRIVFSYKSTYQLNIPIYFPSHPVTALQLQFEHGNFNPFQTDSTQNFCLCITIVYTIHEVM